MSFQKYLYQRDLHASFIHIFRNVCKILNGFHVHLIRASQKSQRYFFHPTAISPDDNDIHSIPDKTYIDESVYFSPDISAKAICTYNIPGNIINEYSLYKVENAARNCNRFRIYINNIEQADYIKSISSEPPISNGLNRKEQLVFKYGEKIPEKLQKRPKLPRFGELDFSNYQYNSLSKKK